MHHFSVIIIILGLVILRNKRLCSVIGIYDCRSIQVTSLDIDIFIYNSNIWCNVLGEILSTKKAKKSGRLAAYHPWLRY
jgi:hypothetical protein